MGREVMPLTARRLEEAAGVLGQAFRDDPFWLVLFEGLDEDERLRQLTWFFAVGCYLETANPRNVRPYERLGFQTVGEKEIMGARVWSMWRDPQHLTISRRDRPSAQRAG